MRRQIQLRGERDWAGDDLIDLQNEPIKALDAIFTPYPACVISGCEITANATRFNVSAGYVSIKGLNHDNVAVSMVVPFAGLTDTVLPIYLTLASQAVTDVYGDGAMKPIAYNYVAEAATIKPSASHLEISTTAKVSFMDVVQSDARRWATKELLEKLDGIAIGANKYIHPDNANTRHVTDDEKTAWNAKASTQLATLTKNGLMPAIQYMAVEVFGKRAYSQVIGRVALTDVAGLLPANLLTSYKGSVFSVELMNAEGWKSYYYRITHNMNTSNLPRVFVEVGAYPGQPLSVNVFNIQDKYFDVAFTSHSTSFSDFNGYPAAFNFSIERVS